MLRRLLVLPLLVLFVLPVSAQDGPDVVRVAIYPFLSYAPYFIAQEEGYFAEQGLEVEFVRDVDSSRLLPALLRGDLDVQNDQLGVSVFNAIARGADIQIVADKGYFAEDHCPSTALVMRRDVFESGALEDAEQLSQMRINTEPGALEEFVLRRAFEQLGLPAVELQFEDVPPPLVAESLANGSIQLSGSAEPWLTRILNAGDNVIVRSSEETVPGLQSAFMIYGPRLLHDDPELGRRFMIAYLKGHRQYLEGKTERNIEILAAYTDLDPELLEEACWIAFRDDAMIEPEGMLAFQEWAVEQGYQDRIVEVDEFWNPSFVEYASEILDES